MIDYSLGLSHGVFTYTQRDSRSPGQYLTDSPPAHPFALAMTTETSIDVMAELGILEPHEVAQLLKLRHSTVLDLSRRGVLPAFKIGKHWRYRRADLEEWIVRRCDAA